MVQVTTDDQSETAFAKSMMDVRMAAALRCTITTATGIVRYQEGVATTYSFEDVLLRLADLHLRCLGEAPIISLKSQQISQTEAKSAFRVAATLIMQRLSSTPSAQSSAMLGAIDAFLAKHPTTEGLDPVLNTALLHAAAAKNDVRMAESLTLWKNVGMPSGPGGGLGISIGAKGPLDFVKVDLDAIKRLSRADMSGDAIFASSQQLAMTKQQCKGAAQLGGMFVGGLIGFEVGGSAGAAAGAGLGAQAGGYIGDVVCPSVSSNDKPSKGGNGNGNGNGGGSGGGGNDGGGDGDDSDDDPDPPKDDPAVGEDHAGCVANPDWSDFSRRNDPYSSFAARAATIALPYGKGMKAFFGKDSNGVMKILALPQNDRGGFNPGRDLGRDLGRGIEDGRNGTNRSNLAVTLTGEQLLSLIASAKSAAPINADSGNFGLVVKDMGIKTTGVGKQSAIATAFGKPRQLQGDQFTITPITAAHDGTRSGEDGNGGDSPSDRSTAEGEVVGYVVTFEPGTTAYALFGPMLTGDRAKAFAENPNLIRLLNKGGSVADPSRGSADYARSVGS